MSAYWLGRTAPASSESALELRYGAPARKETGIDVFFGRLVQYIPADVVAGYVVVSGFISEPPKPYTPGWITAGVFLAITPVLVIVGYLVAVRKQGAARKFPAFRIDATIAYVTWVFALPGSPFRNLGSYGSWARPLALVAVTVLLTAVSPLFDS